jgi:hypothetical protein
MVRLIPDFDHLGVCKYLPLVGTLVVRPLDGAPCTQVEYC